MRILLSWIFNCSLLASTVVCGPLWDELQKRHDSVQSLFATEGPSASVLQEFDKLVRNLWDATEKEVAVKEEIEKLMPQILFKKAIMEMNLNKDSLAIEDLEKVLELDPSMQPARNKLVDLLVSRGDFDKLEKFLKVHKEQFVELGELVNLYKVHWSQAKNDFQDAKYNSCIDQLNQIISMSSSNYELYKLYLDAMLELYREDKLQRFTFLDDADMPINKIVISLFAKLLRLQPLKDLELYEKYSSFQLYTEVDFDLASKTIKNCLRIDNEFKSCGDLSKFYSRFADALKALETYSILHGHLYRELENNEQSKIDEDDLNNFKIDFKFVNQFLFKDDLKVSKMELKRLGGVKFANNYEYLQYRGNQFVQEFSKSGAGTSAGSSAGGNNDDILYLEYLLRLGCESCVEIGDYKASHKICAKVKDSKEHPFLPKHIPKIDKLLKQKKYSQADQELRSFSSNVKMTKLFTDRAAQVNEYRQKINRQRQQQQQQQQHQQKQQYQQQQQQQRQFRHPSKKPAHDYYKILEIPRDADDKTIRKAYRMQTLKYHPDKYKGKDLTPEQIEKKMQNINKAYEVLSDKELRERYDRGDDPNDPMNTAQSQPQWQRQQYSNSHGQEGFAFNFGSGMGGGDAHNFFQQFFGGMGGNANQGAGARNGNPFGGSFNQHQKVKIKKNRKKSKTKA